MSYATYPSVFIREKPGAGKKIKHLLWGDYVKETGKRNGAYVEIAAWGATGWVHSTELQKNKLLEVNFVDVGQGDGSFIVTPDDRFLLVDGGEGDNMLRFLKWRFNIRPNGKKKPTAQAKAEKNIEFDAAVISHPDTDHYAGLQPLFDSKNFTFRRIFHSGIVERTGKASLGRVQKTRDISYLTDVCRDRNELVTLLSDSASTGTKQYAKLLRTANSKPGVQDIRMISASDHYLPGYESGPLQIEILAPVPEQLEGQPCYRWFGDAGKTKNGHSVVMRIRYGNVSILIGGDLNVASENYLLSHYTGGQQGSFSSAQVLAKGRKVFSADVAKACHHGSGDFSEEFLQCVDATATVISSGDDEPYSHPRPDALGAFGRWGHGERPLVFSTELARSTKDSIKHPEALREQIRVLTQILATTSGTAKEKIEAKLEKILSQLDRSVAVYGMINLRTDGKRLVMAQRLERERPGTSEKWDIHRFEPDAQGKLAYQH